MDLLHFVDNDEDFQLILQSRKGRRRYLQPEHASRPRTPFQYVSDHYGIDVTVLRALVEEATERADFFDPLPRAHRPAQWNPARAGSRAYVANGVRCASVLWLARKCEDLAE